MKRSNLVFITFLIYGVLGFFDKNFNMVTIPVMFLYSTFMIIRELESINNKLNNNTNK